MFVGHHGLTLPMNMACEVFVDNDLYIHTAALQCMKTVAPRLDDKPTTRSDISPDDEPLHSTASDLRPDADGIGVLERLSLGIGHER